MITKRFKPLDGEHITAVAPPVSADVFDTWRRRLRLFSGRALTASALRQEQAVRAGSLTTAGQLVSAGVVDGLQITPSVEAGSIMLEFTSGLGLTRTGEVVTIPSGFKVGLEKIPGFIAPPQRPNARNQFGLLVLEPVELRLAGEADPGDQCDFDPTTDAFVDWQQIDGCQLRFIPWPVAELGAIPPNADMRNAAAWTIFRKEEEF